MQEITVKIGLKQKEDEKGIIVEVLLDSEAIRLVIRFKKTKSEKPIYVRNVNSTFNYEGPIDHTVEVELFFKEHKEKTLMDIIGGQKQSVILEML